MHTTSGNTRRLPNSPTSTLDSRQISGGSAWLVGGSAAVASSVLGIPNGRGGMLSTGTNAPLYKSAFFKKPDLSMETDMHERRLALALDIDQSMRLLDVTSPSPHRGQPSLVSATSSPGHKQLVWKDNQWMRDSRSSSPKLPEKEKKPVPIIPFRVLDAPSMRDDFYCSLLAYSHTARCLAVGLGSHVYLWTEDRGVDTPASVNRPDTGHVTSLSFSSEAGGHAILAIGHSDGRTTLWSPLDEGPRFDSEQPYPISCVCFRPNPVKRPSLRDHYVQVNTEELLVGDERGNVYFYAVEWPTEQERDLFDWSGAFTQLAKITIHTQQVCGLAWQFDGAYFATGGNDNCCFLFETKRIANATDSNVQSWGSDVTIRSLGHHSSFVVPGSGPVNHLGRGSEKHKWAINAAVKAIAFCPWQRGLIAIGGGSNDRCIRFYHTGSGACLATIDCAAQVTSLIWSTTRKEIVATFGFAQPEHPYRIAVFSWPRCEQIVAIPWYDEHRALYAISYPGGPNNGTNRGEGGAWWSRTAQEGCVVVATSDACIKFHEIWSEERRTSVASSSGLLGGSDILESLHGIDKELERAIR